MEVAACIQAFHDQIADGPPERVLRVTGYVLAASGFLSLFGSAADTAFDDLLVAFGFASTLGGAILVMIDWHLASERLRNLRWVWAARSALNQRADLLETEIWNRVWRR